MQEHLAMEVQIKVRLADADVMALYRTDPEFEEMQLGIDYSFEPLREDEEMRVAYTEKQQWLQQTHREEMSRPPAPPPASHDAHDKEV